MSSARRAVRKAVLYGGLAAGGAALAQAAYLLATYASPPDCDGPRAGQARAVAAAAAAASAVSAETRRRMPNLGAWWADGMGESPGARMRARWRAATREVTPDAYRNAFAARRMQIQRSRALENTKHVDSRSNYSSSSGDSEPHIVQHFRRAMRHVRHALLRAPALAATATAVPAATRPAEPKDAGVESDVVLVLGDSLVTGVGCCCDDKHLDGGSKRCAGPALARGLAEQLAQRVGVSVRWLALGLTGGSVRELTEEVVPRLAAVDDAVRAKVTTVVIVCGVNDWKRVWRFWNRRNLNPAVFGNELETLIAAVRTELGKDDVRVVLPAVQAGILFAPRFNGPLGRVLSFLSGIWDEEKRKLSERVSNVLYVEPNIQQFQRLVSERHDPIAAFYSKLDGIHPNALGYERWADWIASRILSAAPAAS
mmetsp:Transcript_15494/g.41612  ORF Transcript_15494/g.41612 Transcript_15494/m.41612 type:complete len:426 (+) Transcript_15494:76-1353(+)